LLKYIKNGLLPVFIGKSCVNFLKDSKWICLGWGRVVFDKKKSCYMYFTIEINQITCSEKKEYSHIILQCIFVSGDLDMKRHGLKSHYMFTGLTPLHFCRCPRSGPSLLIFITINAF
jgi:hypothetical protein